jgi:hypothetical protein
MYQGRIEQRVDSVDKRLERMEQKLDSIAPPTVKIGAAPDATSAPVAFVSEEP